jgi:Flp pilus assembly CpaE family ATPase
MCRRSAARGSIDYFIPNDDALALEAANRGVPIYDIRRRSRMGRAISAMADQCVKKIAERAASAQAAG